MTNDPRNFFPLFTDKPRLRTPEEKAIREIRDRHLLLGRQNYPSTASDLFVLILFIETPTLQRLEVMPGVVQTFREFSAYLRHTLIPDLKASDEPTLWASAPHFEQALKLAKMLRAAVRS